MELTPRPPDKTVVDDIPIRELRQRFASQHPFHEDFALAYQNLGGVVHLTEWAETEPDKFYAMMVRLAPPPKETRHSGVVQINVNSQLQPSPLDAAPIEGDFSHAIEQPGPAGLPEPDGQTETAGGRPAVHPDEKEVVNRE